MTTAALKPPLRLGVPRAGRLIASLRGRLVAGVVALAAAGMLLVGALTYATQRSALLDRSDTQLVSASGPLNHKLKGSQPPLESHAGPPAGDGAPSDTYGELRTAT